MTTVADIMTRRPVMVDVASTVAEAVDVMKARGISSVLVPPVPGSAEYGIVTMRDVIGKVVKEDVDSESVRVGDIMTWRLITASPSWTVQEVAAAMARAGVRRLPVVEGLEIVGLVSDTDVFTSLIPRHEWEHARQARKERARARASRTEPAQTVADLMSAPALTVHAAATVRGAVAKMVAAGISSLLVTDDGGRTVGIVTKRDVVIKAVARGQDPERATVADLMSSPVQTIEARATLEECSSQMASARVRRFPVTRAGDIVGIISDGDILAAVAGHRWFGHRRSPTARIAADVMRPPEVERESVWADALAPELSIWECAARLARAGVSELPVVQDERIIGIVSEADIVRALEERGGLD